MAVLVNRQFTTDNQNKKQNYLYEIRSYDVTGIFKKVLILFFIKKFLIVSTYKKHTFVFLQFFTE